MGIVEKVEVPGGTLCDLSLMPLGVDSISWVSWPQKSGKHTGRYSGPLCCDCVIGAGMGKA